MTHQWDEHNGYVGTGLAFEDVRQREVCDVIEGMNSDT